MKLRLGSFAPAAPPAPEALSTVMPGSMPAESEALSSLASVRTTRDFAVQLSCGAMAGHLWHEIKDLLLILVGPDRLAGNGKEYKTGSESGAFDAKVV